MLQVKDLCVSYHTKRQCVHALGPINLTVEEGGIYAVIGPSGCGKSTLLHVLSGIISSYSGEVVLKGGKLDPRTHSIGFIPQNFGLLPWKNVEQNCLLSLHIKKIEINEQIKERITYIMERLDIASLRYRYPSQLSGGQRQRAAIARSFIMNPDILLMDEPFSALDALTREDAQELFIDIWNQYRITTVFVTHSIEEAVYMGQKIILLSNSPGTVVEIIDNPLFNTENLRENGEYLKLSGYMRSHIKNA